MRFILTALGVAIGAASVVATILASQAAVRSMKEDVQELAGRARLEITRSGGLDETLMGELRPFSREASLIPIVEERVLLPGVDDVVRIFGVDFVIDDLVRDLDWGVEGEPDEEMFLSLLRGEGVLLPQSLAERLDAEKGGRIAVSILSRELELDILEVFTPQTGASAWDRVIVMDIAYAQSLFGRAGRIDRIELLPREGVDLDSLQQRLGAALPADMIIQRPETRGDQTSRMVRALQFNLTALSGISLLVGGVLVATTLYTSIVQRRYLIALLRSLGASRGQLAFAVSVEALAIGLIGGVFGVVAGYLGANAALSSVRATVSVIVHDAPASTVEFQWWVAALGVGLGALTSLAAAIGPMREAMKTPPLQELKTERPQTMTVQVRRRPLILAAVFMALGFLLSLAPPIYDLPYAALGASLAVLAAVMALMAPGLDALASLTHALRRGPFPSTLQLAVAGLSAGRGRAAWAAGAIGVSAALAVAMAVMLTSFRQTVVDWTDQGLRSDVWVRPMASQTGIPAGRLSPELVELLRTVIPDDQLDPFHVTDAYIDGERVTLGAGEFSVVMQHGGVPFRDGRDAVEVFAETLDTHGAIVNEPFARRFNVQEGDIITLETRAGPIERRIVGVYYDYSSHQGMVIVDRNDYLEWYPNDGPQGIAIFLPDEADAEAVREKIYSVLDSRWLVEVFINRELKAEVLRIFDRTFAITAIMQIIASIVAAIAVVTVLFALVNERKQDLSLLRAIGAARSQTVRLILYKAGLLGALGAAGGLLGGAAVGVILVKVVNLQSFRWSLQLIWPVGELAGLFLAILAACALAGALPAWAVTRRNLQTAIRDDG